LVEVTRQDVLLNHFERSFLTIADNSGFVLWPWYYYYTIAAP
jgi:hypothetical protein